MIETIQRYRITVGVTPKLTASDKLSNSAPILEVALSILALNPSTRSKKAASKTQTTADFHSDSSANLIPVRPSFTSYWSLYRDYCCLYFKNGLQKIFSCHKYWGYHIFYYNYFNSLFWREFLLTKKPY